ENERSALHPGGSIAQSAGPADPGEPHNTICASPRHDQFHFWRGLRHRGGIFLVLPGYWDVGRRTQLGPAARAITPSLRCLVAGGLSGRGYFDDADRPLYDWGSLGKAAGAPGGMILMDAIPIPPERAKCPVVHRADLGGG